MQNTTEVVQICWAKDARRYSATIQQDLLGQWVLSCEWWGVWSRKRGQKDHLCPSYDEAIALLQRVCQRRVQRRYILTSISPSTASTIFR